MTGWLIRLTTPLVQRLARAYGLQVLPGPRAHGQHPLVFDDSSEVVAHAIPKSCFFNTRSGSIRVGHQTVFGEDVKVLTGMHMGKAQAAATGKPLHSFPKRGATS